MLMELLSSNSMESTTLWKEISTTLLLAITTLSVMHSQCQTDGKSLFCTKLFRGCSYDYISQPFQCPQTGAYTNFFIQYSGIDQYGYAFDRYLESNCARYGKICRIFYMNIYSKPLLQRRFPKQRCLRLRPRMDRRQMYHPDLSKWWSCQWR